MTDKKRIVNQRALSCGFLFQKDLLLSGLLSNRYNKKLNDNDIKLKVNLPFLDIKQRINIRFDPKIFIRVKKVKTNNNIVHNKKYSIKKIKEIKNLKFPLPRVKSPPLSSIDLYPHLKGNFQIVNMDDDSNISSKKSKRFLFAPRDTESNVLISHSVINLFKNNNHFNKTITKEKGSLSSREFIINSNRFLYKDKLSSVNFENEILRSIKNNSNTNKDFFFQTSVKI